MKNLPKNKSVDIELSEFCVDPLLFVNDVVMYFTKRCGKTHVRIGDILGLEEMYNSQYKLEDEEQDILTLVNRWRSLGLNYSLLEVGAMASNKKEKDDLKDLMTFLFIRFNIQKPLLIQIPPL